MTRRRRIVLLTSAGGLALALAGFATLRAYVGRDEVPTARVERRAFERRITAEGVLTAVKATPLTAPLDTSGPMKIAWLAPDGGTVKAGDVVVRFDPTDKEKELADGRADREVADRRIAKKRLEDDATLRGMDRDAEAARLELDQARTFQSKDPDVFSRIQIIESEIDQTLADKRVDHAVNARRTKASLSQADVDLLAIARRKAEIKMREGAEGLRSLAVTAPHAGILTYKRDWRGNTSRVGEMVWSGEPIAEIPDLNEMQAEIYVLEADAGGLAAGLPATVTIESHPEAKYAAKVKRVDTLARPRFRGTPVQYFSLTLELERTDPELMKPGQRVRADLVLEPRADALVVPRQAVMDRDGRRVVWRRGAQGGFEPVEVTLGPAGLGRVVIEKGIAPGDEIALRDPTRGPEDDEPEQAAERSKAPPSPQGGGS